MVDEQVTSNDDVEGVEKRKRMDEMELLLEREGKRMWKEVVRRGEEEERDG